MTLRPLAAALLLSPISALAQTAGQPLSQDFKPAPLPKSASTLKGPAILKSANGQPSGPSAPTARMVPPAVKAAQLAVDPLKIRAHVQFLADDLLEGRGPGTRGAELAAQYLATQFAVAGLKPAGDDGTYLQHIDMVGMKVDPAQTSFTLQPASGAPMPLRYADDYTVSSPQLQPLAEFNAPIVFVGYGVTAPEFHWDDYAGTDVKGKVVMLIVGDPPSKDPAFFGGDALTYYGRWTYKFEEAARHGAAGVLIIHRTDLASYGWDVVKNSFTSEKTYLRDQKGNQLKAAAWIQLDIAKKIFAASGKNLDQEFAAAGKPGFHAEPLTVALQAKITSTVRPFRSSNVVGILPGTDKGTDQAVMYTAHYDHLGIVAGMSGDNIYNGAADNATGCGMLLEMARVWSNMNPAGAAPMGGKLAPPHTVIFAAVTAEEQGLLGSQYLGEHPPIPAGQIALDINYDTVLPIGVPMEVNVNGAQRTDFFPTVEAVAKRSNLAIVPDPKPSAGTYYRSDHFSLSRVGIPAFSIDPGDLFEGHPLAWGQQKMAAFNANNYHNFSDNFQPDWDFAGNAKLVRFGIELGWLALSSPHTIAWNPSDEFEAARKQSLSQ
jgi:Zn-dependent M28 family amino/carboxypeptidase